MSDLKKKIAKIRALAESERRLGNLDAANNMTAKADELEERLKSNPGHVPPTSFEDLFGNVFASQGWNFQGWGTRFEPKPKTKPKPKQSEGGPDYRDPNKKRAKSNFDSYQRDQSRILNFMDFLEANGLELDVVLDAVHVISESGVDEKLKMNGLLDKILERDEKILILQKRSVDNVTRGWNSAIDEAIGVINDPINSSRGDMCQQLASKKR